MTEGLTIEACDYDSDLLLLDIQASNGRFAGSVEIYGNNDELARFAACIAGFPASYRDRRSWEFGCAAWGTAGGYCTITLRCADRSGHVAVDLTFDGKRPESPATAQLSFRTEPSAIDTFVNELRALHRGRAGSATLRLDSAFR